MIDSSMFGKVMDSDFEIIFVPIQIKKMVNYLPFLDRDLLVYYRGFIKLMSHYFWTLHKA